MNEDTVRKWILKADNDLKVAKDELETDEPVTDAVCFHAQQCAEKYLKAFLIFNGEEISRTHDIAYLIALCSELDPDFKNLNRVDVVALTDYAVEIRYPDDFYFPDVEEARSAVEIAEEIKDFVLKKLKKKGYKRKQNAEKR
ncbi:MAG TPA: HEPN domain-containing protein [Thermotogaceae bacterium]|nr:HEPN domain-containing protein [Thermotogaceae bacterium]